MKYQELQLNKMSGDLNLKCNKVMESVVVISGEIH